MLKENVAKVEKKVEKLVVERPHQIKKKENRENPEKPRTIACRFCNYKDKTNILKNAKK